MTATVNKRFGKAIFEAAQKRAQTDEGKAELRGYNVDEVLVALEKFTETLDELPDNLSVNSVYLALNVVGSALIATVEQNRRETMRQTGGQT